MAQDMAQDIKLKRTSASFFHLLLEFLDDGILGRLALDRKDSNYQMFVRGVWQSQFEP